MNNPVLESVLHILFAWLTSMRTLLVIGVVLILWFALWSLNATVHEGCVDSTSSVLRNSIVDSNLCAMEVARNSRIINTVFQDILLPVSLVVTFLWSLVRRRSF